MFQVPESSPPSTPNTNRDRLSAWPSSNPSTTPAGPPPASMIAASTTPAGPPPASLFQSLSSNPPLQPVAIPISFGQKTTRSTPQKRRLDSTLIGTQQYDGDEFMAEFGPDGDEDPFAIPPRKKRPTTAPETDEIRAVRRAARDYSKTPTKEIGSDQLVLDSDRFVRAVVSKRADKHPEALESDLSQLVQDLVGLYDKEYPVNTDTEAVDPGRIGPSDEAPAAAKAAFLASLLMKLHHPPRDRNTQFGASRYISNRPISIPEMLLRWLREHHNPLNGEFEEVLSHQPNCAAHERYWDVIFTSALRGDLQNVRELFRAADFSLAVSAIFDGEDEIGYQDSQLETTRLVVADALEVVSQCPAIQSQDWNVSGTEWSVFRRRIRVARAKLEMYAEGGRLNDNDDEQSAFEATIFDLSTSRRMNLARSRRDVDRVPWTIYQNMSYLYGQLLGKKEEILAAAASWVEATIGMVVWWDGDDENDDEYDDAAAAAAATMAVENFAASRRSTTLHHSQRLVDLQPHAAYLQRLAFSLQLELSSPESSEDPEMQVNSTDPVIVGLACVFLGDVEGVIGLLKLWSPTIATNVVEVADAGSWLGTGLSRSTELMKGFDQSDLMVLSYAPEQNSTIDHDAVLGEYADLLAKRSGVKMSPKDFLKGWHLSLYVLARLHQRDVAAQRIVQLLDAVIFDNETEATLTVSQCYQLGFVKEARHASKNYADLLMESNTKFGAAALFYAQAGEASKVRDVLDFLTSLCLVQSAAYPSAKDTDLVLSRWIESPRKSIMEVRQLESTATDTLVRRVCGYAAVRSFYELRDHSIARPAGKKQTASQPASRKHEAASTLLALIQSAGDSIHGGLYDQKVDSAVPVEGLLVLLGEALAFLNQPTKYFSQPQIFALLKAVEDLSTVSATIFKHCEEVFKAALANANGIDMPSPRSLLKKSSSGLSASSYSMVGSGLLTSTNGSGKSAEGSGVLVEPPISRTWDWRTALAKDATGKDVLDMLRLCLTREIASTWIMDTDV